MTRALLSSFMAVLALTGCTFEPPTPEQLAARALRAEQRAAEEQARRDFITRLYTSGVYGTILQCVLRDGQVDFERWRSYEPVTFTLVPTEEKDIRVRAKDSSRTRSLNVSLSEDGGTVSICRWGPPSSGVFNSNCANVVGIFTEFQAGLSQDVLQDDFIRGASLTCAYRPGPGGGNPSIIVLPSK